MFINLLDEASSTSGSGWYIYVVLAVIVVAFIAWIFFSGRKNKAHQREYVEQLDAIRPGNKVKTAGGICGIVVEVCDDNTVIIETGSEQSGKSYVKMDKELIAQTDAKGPTQIAREQAEAARAAEKAAKKAGKNGETEEKPDETAAAPEETAEEASAAEEAADAPVEERQD